METLILAAVVFLAGHLAVSSTPLRPLLVRALGEKPYLGLYSVGAVAALGWLIAAWLAAPRDELWVAGPALRGLPGLVLPFALLAVVVGMSRRNPTYVGQSLRPGAAEPARGILRITRHPNMWAITLWGAAHMAVNGDTASLVFFGSFVVLALLGARLQERRMAVTQGAEWERFLAATSFVPFAAILAGRNRFVWAEIGWARLLVTVVLYVVLMAGGHQWLFGARPY